MGLLDKALAVLAAMWTAVLDTYVSALIPISIVAFVILWNLAWSWLRRAKATEGKDSMSRRRRVKQVVGDAIVDSIENLVHANVINRRDANYFYRRLAEEMNLPDLMPRGGVHIPSYMRQELLKHTIAERVTNGNHKPVLTVLEGKRDAIPVTRPVTLADLAKKIATGA